MTENPKGRNHGVDAPLTMRLMRLMPIYQKPNTSCPATHAGMCEREQARKGTQDLPLSAGRLQVDQLWCADITYLPMRRGFLYPQGAGVAHLEYARGRLLRRGAERGHPQVHPN